jgi:hypothetical protein
VGEGLIHLLETKVHLLCCVEQSHSSFKTKLQERHYSFIILIEKAVGLQKQLRNAIEDIQKLYSILGLQVLDCDRNDVFVHSISSQNKHHP